MGGVLETGDEASVVRLVAALSDAATGVLDAVIKQHGRSLAPHGLALIGEPHCRFDHGDFFALITVTTGFDSVGPRRKFECILLPSTTRRRDVRFVDLNTRFPVVVRCAAYQ